MAKRITVNLNKLQVSKTELISIINELQKQTSDDNVEINIFADLE